MPSATLDSYPPSKAPLVEGPKQQRAKAPDTPFPKEILDAARQTIKVSFDPKRHLAYQPPENIITMKEIGLGGQGISPHAVTDPFSFLTKEAILQMRAELFSQNSVDNCRFSSDLVPNVVRGLTPVNAPFCFALWHSREVLKIISDVAGIELVPCYDYEVANINFSINDAHRATVDDSDQTTSVAWHYDSTPFVCVIMASECDGMIGGETVIRLPNGDVRKVRGPSMGTAVVMQGRYIQHAGLKAFGGRERIAMVTSFRPRDPLVNDETTLAGLRAISNVDHLYTQFNEYRMEIVEERFRRKIKEERERVRANQPFNTKDMREWLKDQRDFINETLQEIIELD